jgi:hypothetical protein
VNDCDHAFLAEGLGDTVRKLDGTIEGALVGFPATSPAYSYVRLDERGAVTGTVEKEVVSPYAIAGCYLFADPARFAERFERYRRECTYAELFLSGVYNTVLDDGGEVLFHPLARHVSFGTPEELDRVAPASLDFLRPAGA